LQALDEFIEAMMAIDREAWDTPRPGEVRPACNLFKRLDEVRAARQPGFAAETAELRRRGGAGE
jgi:hypothetical protein